MTNLFKSKSNCEICSKPLEKNKYHIFDASHRNYYKKGEKLKLCTVCLIKKYKEYLKNFPSKAIVIEPFDNHKFSAYQYYTFEDMLKYNWPKDVVDELKKLTPEEGKCTKCKNTTSFKLYPPNLYDRNPYDFKVNKQCESQLMCAECLSDHLWQIIDREQSFFSEVWPPLKAEGVATSFEG